MTDSGVVLNCFAIVHTMQDYDKLQNLLYLAVSFRQKKNPDNPKFPTFIPKKKVFKSLKYFKSI